MGLGSVSSGGSLYAEVCAALYESAKRPLVVSFMAGMGGEAIVLKEFYWMTQQDARGAEARQDRKADALGRVRGVMIRLNESSKIAVRCACSALRACIRRHDACD